MSHVWKSIVLMAALIDEKIMAYIPYDLLLLIFIKCHTVSVCEKLFGTSDIMSDVFRPCVGHFHIVLDIFSFFNNANQFKDKE